jgi:hypothetical protein
MFFDRDISPSLSTAAAQAGKAKVTEQRETV